MTESEPTTISGGARATPAEATTILSTATDTVGAGAGTSTNLGLVVVVA